MNSSKYIRWLLAVLFLGMIIIVSYLLYHCKNSADQKEPRLESTYVPQSQEPYKTIAYDALIHDTKGLSTNQLKQHYDLYAGYVKKRNQIEKDLQTVDRTNAASTTYSPYRALKVAETFAVNGSLLHQLYFENMHATGSQPGEITKKLIDDSFGSFENFKKDFFDAAGVARGWVVLAYGLDDGRLHNYVLEAHNLNVPILSIPILVLDVYEHAYMIDFGIKRANYLDVFWNNIDWNVVEQRIVQWVMPFKDTLQALNA